MKIFTFLILMIFYSSFSYADDCGIKFIEKGKNLNEKFINCPPDFEGKININYEIAYENIRKALTSCLPITQNIVTGEVYSNSNTAEVLVFDSHQYGSALRDYFRITKDGQDTIIKSWMWSPTNPHIVIPHLTEELARGGWEIDCKIIDDAVDEYHREITEKNKTPL